jgi:hypothetical protein
VRWRWRGVELEGGSGSWRVGRSGGRDGSGGQMGRRDLRSEILVVSCPMAINRRSHGDGTSLVLSSVLGKIIRLNKIPTTN